LVYRRTAFDTGLQNAGYELRREDHKPRPGDILVTWNRYGANDELAKRWERAGARAVVVENGYLGKQWQGGEWFAIAYDHHNGAGVWPKWDFTIPSRWDVMEVPIASWREPRSGGEVVVLAQRGIGEPGVRMEQSWLASVKRLWPEARIRPHPGLDKTGIPLDKDLTNASYVVTWGSGAALKALLSGVPVVYGLPKWIGAPSSVSMLNGDLTAMRPDNRLMTFRRMMWAQWNIREVLEGTPFICLREYCSLVGAHPAPGV
jgi:hypothetical protein